MGMNFLTKSPFLVSILLLILILPFSGDIGATMVRVYTGNGTINSDLVINELRKYSSTSVLGIGKDELLKGNWAKNNETKLLVIPGGRDIPYTEDLNGKGNAIIKQFVLNGGSYLGLCAGGYYAGSSLYFAPTNASYVIAGPRELAFYPGKVIGPAYGIYDQYGSSDIKAAPITWSDGKTEESLEVFYKGGGYFENALSFSTSASATGVTVLAWYRDLREAAIVECKIGNKGGKAILTGVHPEYPLPYTSEEKRVRLLQGLLNRLL